MYTTVSFSSIIIIIIKITSNSCTITAREAEKLFSLYSLLFFLHTNYIYFHTAFVSSILFLQFGELQRAQDVVVDVTWTLKLHTPPYSNGFFNITLTYFFTLSLWLCVCHSQLRVSAIYQRTSAAEAGVVEAAQSFLLHCYCQTGNWQPWPFVCSSSPAAAARAEVASQPAKKVPAVCTLSFDETLFSFPFSFCRRQSSRLSVIFTCLAVDGTFPISTTTTKLYLLNRRHFLFKILWLLELKQKEEETHILLTGVSGVYSHTHTLHCN